MGCSKEMTFVPQILKVGRFRSEWSDEVIKNEPMFFNCDLDFVIKKAGKITKAFLKGLPTSWACGEVVFDSRVHMLMPGWYPAIPGWHHDDVPRPVKTEAGPHFITGGQPDYDNPAYHSEHLTGLVNAEICPTAFISSSVTMPSVPEGELIYRTWHARIEELLKAGQASQIEASSGELIQFDWKTFHTGTKCVMPGWRWFGRLSRNTERTKNITNEIRRQAQVYLEFPMEGW